MISEKTLSMIDEVLEETWWHSPVGIVPSYSGDMVWLEVIRYVFIDSPSPMHSGADSDHRIEKTIKFDRRAFEMSFFPQQGLRDLIKDAIDELLEKERQYIETKKGLSDE